MEKLEIHPSDAYGNDYDTGDGLVIGNRPEQRMPHLILQGPHLKAGSASVSLSTKSQRPEQTHIGVHPNSQCLLCGYDNRT